MTHLSPHFKREEFACKCGCGYDTVDVALLSTLEFIRQYFKKPITINSGCRCEAYNKKIGGEDNSWHMKARAADIVVKDIDPDKVADLLEQNGWNGGLGRYNTFTHIDTRDVKARWDLRQK